MGDFEQKTMQRDLEEKNRKDDQALQERNAKRKKLEMEAKLFQDKQVAEKKEMKRLETLQRVNEQERIAKLAEDYKL